MSDTCPRGDDCDLTAAYMTGYHERDDEVRALAARLAEVKVERDMLREADGNFWAAIDKAEAAEARAERLEAALRQIANPTALPSHGDPGVLRNFASIALAALQQEGGE